jgi:hypothetical protein
MTGREKAPIAEYFTVAGMSLTASIAIAVGIVAGSID